MNNSMVCKGIRIAICDDDKLIAIQIKKLVNDILTKTGKEPLIEVYLSGKSFLNSKAIYDIVFMDIELNEENGLEILNKYRVDHDSLFIILTSHAEEVSRGYYVRAFRFLLKPVDIPLLKEGIYSAIDSINEESRLSVIDENGCAVPVKQKDIVYFEAGDKKSGVKTMHNFYLVNMNLKDIITLLDTEFFLVHRSYIINMNYIEKINGERLCMMDGSVISISRLKKTIFKDTFYNFIRRKSWIDSSL